MPEWIELQPDLTPTWNYKEQKTIQGVLAEKKDNVGPNGSNLYILEDEEGKKTGVWGSAIIDTRLQNAEVGIEVRIEYLGLEKSPKTKREYHNFKVYKKQTLVSFTTWNTDELGEAVKDLGKGIE